MQRGPIFIAGLERSGTSLLFALLASNPHLAMTRRTNLWTHFYNQYGDLSIPANLDRCLGTMMRYRRVLKLQPDAARLRRDFLAGPATYAHLFALLEQQYADRLGRPRWGDKSLNTERYADEIFAAYPGARIIHMLRDPRDRYASSLTRWQVRRGGVGAGTAEWLASARLALRHRRRYPDRYLVVRYETLVSQPSHTLQQVCAFVDEPYLDEMLAMRGAPRLLERGSNSSYGPRDPGVISTDSIGKFREVLAPSQIACIQTLAKREMAVFRYDLEPHAGRSAQRTQFALRDLPLEFFRLLAWRARERARNHAGRPVPAYRLVEAGERT
jgi:hypothetical protein